MATIGKHQLQEGDILMRHGSNKVTHGQSIIRPFTSAQTQAGSVLANHAAIICQRLPGISKHRPGEIWMAEAGAAAGLSKRQLMFLYEMQDSQNWSVYRLRNNVAVAAAAGAVARTWSTGNAGGQIAQYSIRKALRAGFGSISFGPMAKARAAQYHAYAKQAGGPKGFSHDKKEMFCSMFVVACYQAVGGVNSGTYMGVDSAFTSPMALEGYLNSSGAWQLIADSVVRVEDSWVGMPQPAAAPA
jgi:hypothetical protein